MRRVKLSELGDGFTVDTTVYPWFAYKGPRFVPTESQLVFTTNEAELMEMLANFIEYLYVASYGDGAYVPEFDRAESLLKRLREESGR
jgi:hypothetical protein